jgi:enediyne biosynthesis protein E5
MTTAAPITTLRFYPKQKAILRVFALWYFTALITFWTFLGHIKLGFEQAWIHPLVGVATAFVFQFFLEWVDARANGRKPRYAGSVGDFLNFLPPAIIPGLACAMLLYPNEKLMPIIFAVALSICSKVIFRAPVGDGKTQHIFNPSNLGITVTLLCFPWVGLAPPYHFTENLTGIQHWLVPGFIILTGLVIHGLATGRLILVVTWLIAFVIQGELRSLYFGFPWYLPLTPMTSASFVVFTLYMIPDPATTPIKPWRQVAFGVAIAAIYGLLFVSHQVFTLFIALALTSALRGLWLYVSYAYQFLRGSQQQPAMPSVSTTVGPKLVLSGPGGTGSV